MQGRYTVNAGDNGDLNVEDAVSAKIKGTDADNDLAVVAVKKSDIPEDTLNQIKIAQIGSSDDLAVGQQVVAIGNALGYGQSVTSGWISALNRTISTDDGTNSTGLIQTDAAINPGNIFFRYRSDRFHIIGMVPQLPFPKLVSYFRKTFEKFPAGDPLQVFH